MRRRRACAVERAAAWCSCWYPSSTLPIWCCGWLAGLTGPVDGLQRIHGPAETL